MGRYPSTRKTLGDRPAPRAPKEKQLKPEKPKKDNVKARAGSQPTSKPKPSAHQQTLVRGITYYKAGQAGAAEGAVGRGESLDGAGMRGPWGTFLPRWRVRGCPHKCTDPKTHLPAESPARGPAVPERQEERDPPPPTVKDAPAQAIVLAETPVPSTTSAPSAALSPRTTARSPSSTALGQGADSTGGPETPNRGG